LGTAMANLNVSHSNDARNITIAAQITALVFVATIGAGFLGALDPAINVFFDWVMREDSNRFERAFLHLVGPKSWASEVRSTDFGFFVQLVFALAFMLAIAAFSAAKLVLNFADAQERSSANEVAPRSGSTKSPVRD